MPKSLSILFPCSPLDRKVVDQSYASEQEAATLVGLQSGLYSHELLESGDAAAAVRSFHGAGRGILRGWMMTGEQYASLSGALATRGFTLVTAPANYDEAHYLPIAYPKLEGTTPKTAWIDGDEIEAAWQLYQVFQQEDAVIKDWVKSAKHRWREACFIPANSTVDQFREIFRNFRQARGHLFNRGVVIRKFERLVSKGTDMKGFPLVEEYRLFYFEKRMIAHPEVDGVDGVLKQSKRWDLVAAKFGSPFISIDVARLKVGDWTIIEVGDGGVSGLPLSIDPRHFYSALAQA